MALLRVIKGKLQGTIHAVHDCERPTLIGRDPAVNVTLPDERASREHSRIFRAFGSWVVEDLGSRNGTLLEGKRIQRAPLEDGSLIQIGGTLLRFHSDEFPPPPLEEIRGIRLLNTVHEESGIFVHHAYRDDMECKVRLDRLATGWKLSRPVLDVLARAVEEAGSVTHPGVDPLIDSVLGDESHLYLTLRLPVGKSLNRRLDRVLRASLERRLSLLRPLVDVVLDRATKETLRSPLSFRQIHVHKNHDGQPSISIAAIETPALVSERLGSLCHLPEYLPYLPPELTKSEEVPATIPLSSVIYSLGAVCYHLITGQPPMGKADHRKVLENHRQVEAAPANLVNQEVPEPLSVLLGQMLAKDPGKRPADRDEILGILDRTRDQIAEARVESPPSADRRAPAPAQEPSSIPRPSSRPRPSSLPRKGRRHEESLLPAETPTPEEPRESASVGYRKNAMARQLVLLPFWVVISILAFFCARWLSGWFFLNYS